MSKCNFCNDRGYVVHIGDAIKSRTGLLELQRCDACEKFKTDAEAEQVALTDLDNLLRDGVTIAVCHQCSTLRTYTGTENLCQECGDSHSSLVRLEIGKKVSLVPAVSAAIGVSRIPR